MNNTAPEATAAQIMTELEQSQTFTHWLVLGEENNIVGIVAKDHGRSFTENFQHRLKHCICEHFDAVDLILHPVELPGYDGQFPEAINVDFIIPVTVTTDPEDEYNGSFKEMLTLSPVWEY